jgi:aldehyde:ferredoxin oxidoreductase
MRAFNAREGFTSAEDKLPSKLFKPLADGPSAGIAITEAEVASALSTYYAMCGWDSEGRPTRAKLEELGIAWVADELEAV